MERIKVEPKPKKRKQQQPLAILTADWHIRADVPKCRVDDYFGTMEKKLNFIINKSNKLRAPILIAGDIGDKPQWPNWLLEWFIGICSQLENDLIVIPGQHDLPSHNIDLWRKSGIGVLHSDRTIRLLETPLGTIVHALHIPNRDLDIAMIHDLIIKDKIEWPDQQATKALSLLKKFPEYNLILSGDNHKTFTTKHQGRILVNPGSLMRMAADQIDHKPSVFIWYSDNSIEQLYLPIKKEVIDRTYLDKKSLKESAIRGLILDFKKGFKAEFSFEDNLKQHFKKHRTQKRVQEKIWEAYDNDRKS
jgi:DNA repair exonuclease SbcCD nuclease subunit